MANPSPRKQLRMIWPASRLDRPPTWSLPEGYALRILREGDEPEHIRLMRSAGFDEWNEDKLKAALSRCLPEGIFVVESLLDHTLAATAMATHNPDALHPFGGELGWVAADPAHSGKGLGYAVSAAVTKRFLDAGYRNIYLRTDDHRLAAVKTYLRMGWAPLIFACDMEHRWRAVCKQLGADYESTNPVALPFSIPAAE